jgi:hypothetical protein
VPAQAGRIFHTSPLQKPVRRSRLEVAGHRAGGSRAAGTPTPASRAARRGEVAQRLLEVMQAVDERESMGRREVLVGAAGLEETSLSSGEPRSAANRAPEAPRDPRRSRASADAEAERAPASTPISR